MQPAIKFAVGQSVPRLEDADLLRGRGRYSDDVQLDHCAHAYVLRSSYAHARLLKCDATAARKIVHADRVDELAD